MNFDGKTIKYSMFSILIFLFGIGLTSLTLDQQSKLQSKCSSIKVRGGLNAILMFGVMLTVIPLVQLLCHSVCKCPTLNLWYKKIVIFIMVFLTASGGVVWNGLNEDKSCNTNSVKTFVRIVVILSSSFLFVFLVYPVIQSFIKRRKLINARQRNKSGDEGIEMS